MQGTDVHKVLSNIRASHLHHANSVTTSVTFLREGGLLSRGLVEGRGLKQTVQSSDAIDKKYGIWESIFVDHVDIHDRGGRRKGPNQYGPVLFVFDLATLLQLPPGTEVLVTKKNPIYWRDNEPDTDRWFQNAEELTKGIQFGDFDKMLVIQTPSRMLDFPKRHAQIILDDPQRTVSSGQDAYTHAENQLRAAAAAGGMQSTIQRRICGYDCICIKKYAKYATQKIDFYFT